jgi:tRNA A58 N-methylase Trm61
MPKYKILASREVFYEFEIEADSKEVAEENLKELVQKEQIDKFAYDWAPLEVFDNEKA